MRENDTVTVPKEQIRRLSEWFIFLAGYVRGNQDYDTAFDLLKINDELKSLL